MNYIRYLRSLLYGFLFCMAIYLSAVFYQLGVPISEQNSSIHKVYAFKSSLISTLSQPKLLIIAGSNANAGISCQMIQTTTGVPCFNGGIHAGVGSDYMFSRARSWLKPGDMVLLPLEYNYYRENNVLSDRLVDHVMAHDPMYLYSVNFKTKIRFLAGISFDRLEQGAIAKLKQSGSSHAMAITGQEVNKDQYGDNTHQQEADLTPELRKKIANLKPLPINGYLKSSHGMQSISKFVNWCNERDIKVLATWPNTVWFEYYEQPQVKEFFQSIEDFYDDLGVPVLGQARSAMYDKSMFYDSIYHPHDRGKRQRTKELIGLLQPYLDDFCCSEHLLTNKS